MTKTFWKILGMISLVGAFLTACQPASTPVITPSGSEAAGSYPAPTVPLPFTSGESYPAPSPVLPPYNPYPEPEDGGSIEWAHAEYLILNGMVKQVTQLHSLEVTLVLSDGRTVHTVEPVIDEVFRVIDRCGDLCIGIGRGTQ